MALHGQIQGSLTFLHEDALPPLPLPSLDQTCEKLAKSVEPFCRTEKEYSEFKRKVDNFRCGIGYRLHNVLQVEAATTKNWLERFWDNAAYLNARYPCAVNTNWGVGLLGCGNRDMKPGPTMFVSAACCAAAMAKFYVNTVLKGLTPPEKSNRGMPYSMFQNKKTFGVNQVPGFSVDRHSFSMDKKHIMVLCNNVWYSLDILDNMYQPVESAALAQHLQKIFDDAQTHHCLPFQVLTSQDRDVWAKQRYDLIQYSSVNANIISLIESSLFCITLATDIPEPSHGSPTEEDTIAKAILCSPNCELTWFDHGYNLIAFPNGSTGLQGNHSPADAMTALYMIRWFQESIRNRSIDTVGLIASKVNKMKASAKESSLSGSLKVSRHIFDMKGWSSSEMAVKNALSHSKKLFDSIDVRVVTFNSYGSNEAKKLETSPDALVQMGLILGYYRLNNGELPATYETAHTRQFYHGRTETIRSCSMSVKTMCKAMEDPKISSIEKESFIRDAISAHNKYTVECMNGQGIDRHLLCLQLVAAEMEFENMPSLFSDPLYVKSKSFDLSTSNISGGGFGAPRNEWWGGYAPATADGYGCGYTISPECIKILLTTFRSSSRTSGEQFEKHFCKSMEDLRDIILENASKSNSKL